MPFSPPRPSSSGPPREDVVAAGDVHAAALAEPERVAGVAEDEVAGSGYVRVREALRTLALNKWVEIDQTVGGAADPSRGACAGAQHAAGGDTAGGRIAVGLGVGASSGTAAADNQADRRSSYQLAYRGLRSLAQHGARPSLGVHALDRTQGVPRVSDPRLRDFELKPDDGRDDGLASATGTLTLIELSQFRTHSQCPPETSHVAPEEGEYASKNARIWIVIVCEPSERGLVVKILAPPDPAPTTALSTAIDTVVALAPSSCHAIVTEWSPLTLAPRIDRPTAALRPLAATGTANATRAVKIKSRRIMAVLRRGTYRPWRATRTTCEHRSRIRQTAKGNTWSGSAPTRWLPHSPVQRLAGVNRTPTSDRT